MCLVLLGFVVIVCYVPFPALAGPPLPLRTEGRALDETGTPLSMGTPIRTFVDGVDYSNDSKVKDGAGSFVVLTSGNSKVGANVSDTPTVLEGPNFGDVVLYAAGDFTSFTPVFISTSVWSQAGVVMDDMTLGRDASTPRPVKIQGLVTQPARAGNQVVFLCNPTTSAVFLGDYYLERNAPGAYQGPRFDLTGNLAAGSIVQVNITSRSWLIPAGDALKLVYRNPGGANAPAEGRDIVVDRVEFNATRNGALTWEPANTALGDAVAPGPGQILQRGPGCVDTNDPADFSLALEPGLPSSNGPPSITISSPGAGQTVQGGTTVALEWTLSDDVFDREYVHVWANLTVGSSVIPLLIDAVGATSTSWPAPDEALSEVVLQVDAVDPFGARGTAGRTFGVTRQSPLALAIAILIVVVILAFVILGSLRARRLERRPPPPAPPPSMAPAGPPTTPFPSVAGPGSGERKSCPRCHTLVYAADVTCFFCGYRFPDEPRTAP